MALQAKDLAYKAIEVAPGFGQIALFRLSGQRQVPVLIDGDSVIADSTVIIHHLETQYPKKHLIPHDPKYAAQAHLIEDWADTTLANAAKSALIQAAAINQELRIGLTPAELPKPIRTAIGQLQCEFIGDLERFFNQGEKNKLINSLQKLSSLLENNHWIVGNSLSIADLAVAAQLSLLCFPSSSGEPLEGKGVQGIYDHPDLINLFKWRDQLEKSLSEL